MDFNIDENFSIFDELLKKRPEIVPETLKEDLERYYLPYIQELVTLKKQKDGNAGLLVGVSAIQGTGKTTQGEILEILLGRFGFSTIDRSIDDHYITHKELCRLREADPRFIRRGVTHDIFLAIRDLNNLKMMAEGEVILVSGYDKGVQGGDGDRFAWINLEEGLVVRVMVDEESLVINKVEQAARALKLISATFNNVAINIPENMGSNVPVFGHFLPDDLNGFLEQHRYKQLVVQMVDKETVVFQGEGEMRVAKKDLPNGWRVVTKKPAFIFYDGWMVGARSVLDESIFDSGLPALETPESREFAKYVNKKLVEYEPLWALLEYLTVLYVVNYQDSLAWRDQAEEALRAKGAGMSHDEIREFVYYFWRSVHPGIHIKNLAKDVNHTNQVVIINDNHTVKEVLSPDEVKARYP